MVLQTNFLLTSKKVHQSKVVYNHFMLKTPPAALEGLDRDENLKGPDEIVTPETFDAMSEALFQIRKYPMELMAGSNAALTQQEILAAWLMDEPSIGESLKDIRPEILEANAHLGGEHRALADELLRTLHTITDNAVFNAREAKIDPVIRMAEIKLRYRGIGRDSDEQKDLDRLNAAKAMYNLMYPKSKK